MAGAKQERRRLGSARRAEAGLGGAEHLRLGTGSTQFYGGASCQFTSEGSSFRLQPMSCGKKAGMNESKTGMTESRLQ